MTTSATENNAQLDFSIEKARVIAVQSDALWVETFQQSTCGKCQLKSGCGQGILSQWLGQGTHCFEVLCDEGQAELFTVGQWVEIGLQHKAIMYASLVAYIVPLFLLLGGALLAELLFAQDPVSIIGALAGFLVGLYCVRLFNQKYSKSRYFQPHLIGACP